MVRPAEHQPHQHLLRKLETIFDLSAEEKAALESLPLTLRSMPADTDIVAECARPSECCLLVEGFACRYKITPEGRRQIMSFHIPGDILDLQNLQLKVMDHSLGALAPSKVGFIPHQDIVALMRRHPRIGEALWRDTLIDAAVFREWMVGIGRRSAYARIAHLLCEMLVRLQALGFAGPPYELPLTQEEIGDALGLSTVHVNRVLQELRREGLIVLRGGLVSTPDWEGLKAAGEFDVTYLHLAQEVEPA